MNFSPRCQFFPVSPAAEPPNIAELGYSGKVVRENNQSARTLLGEEVDELMRHDHRESLDPSGQHVNGLAVADRLLDGPDIAERLLVGIASFIVPCIARGHSLVENAVKLSAHARIEVGLVYADVGGELAMVNSSELDPSPCL